MPNLKPKLLILQTLIASSLAFAQTDSQKSDSAPTNGLPGSPPNGSPLPGMMPGSIPGGPNDSNIAEAVKIFDKNMEPILTEYLAVYDALIAGEINDINTHAKNITNLARKLDPMAIGGTSGGQYMTVPMNLSMYGGMLANEKNIDQARETFKRLSQPMAMWVGISKPVGYIVMYCPMVKASWVQKEGQTENPYDKNMLRCGEKV